MTKFKIFVKVLLLINIKEIKFMKNFEQNVKIITIAHRLACEYDYCPDFTDCKAKYNDSLDFKVTDKEVQDACDSWAGCRADEIVNALDRLFL